MTVAGHPGGYGCNGEDTNHNQPRDWRSSELEETFTLPGGMVCPLHGKGYTDRRRAPPPPPPRLAAVARRRCRSRSASAALSQSHERHQATRDGSPDTYNPASATFTNDCDYFADERPSPLGYGWVEPGKGWTRSQRPTSSIPPDAAKKVKKSATLGNITSSDWFNVQSIRDAAWAMSYLSREGGLPRRQTVRPNAAREHPGRRGYHDAPKIVPPRGYDINSSTASRRPNAACLAETHIMQHKLDSARVYNRGLRVSNSELARQVIALRRKVEAIARPTGTASTRRLRSRSPCAGQKATDENAQDTASVTDSSNGNLSMKTDTARRDDDKTGGSPRSFRHNAPSQWHGRRRGEAEGGGLKQKLRSPRVESKSKKTPTEAQQTRRLAPTNVGLERESRQRPEAHAQTQTEVACLASVGGADPATTGRQYFAHQKRNLVVTAHEALTSATTTTNSRPEGTELAEESGAVAGALSSSERGDQMDYHHCHRHDTESLAGREEKSGAAGEEFYSCQGSEPEGRPNSGAEATIATQERTPRAYPVCSRASAARTPEVASSAAEVSPTAQERADPRRRVDAREVVASSTAEVSPATQDRADARRRIGAREIVSSKKEGSRREQGPRHDSKDSGAVGSVDAGLFPVRTRGNSGAVTVEPSARRGDELEGRPETRISPVSARGISGAVTVEPPARRGDELQGRQETRISPVSARGNSGAVKVEPSARRGDELQRRPENKSSISPVRARGDSGAFKVEPSARRGDELQGCPETRISPVPPRGTSGAVTVESSTGRGDELQGRPKTSISPVSARGNSGAVKVDPPARRGDELQGRPETSISPMSARGISGAVKVDPPARRGDELQGRPETSISPMSARGISGAVTVEPRARRGDELQGRPEKKYSISPVPPRGTSGAVTVESSTSRGDELQGRPKTSISPVSARGNSGAVKVDPPARHGDELQGRPETSISPMSARGISGAATVEPRARRGDELQGRPEKKYSISPVPPRGASGAVTVESSTSRGDELQGRLETRTSPVSARGICGAVTVESSTSPGDELQGRPETRISPMSSRGISGAATVEPPARRGDELEGLSATSPGETRLAMVCHTPPPLWSGRSDGQAPPPPPPVPSDETRASPTERQIVEAEQTSRGATRQEGEADCKERPEKQRTETTTTTDTGNAGHAPKKEVEVEDLERKLHSTKRTLGAFKVALILARHRPIGRPNHPGDRFAALPAGLPRVALALSRWRTVPHPGGSRKLDLGSRTSGIPSTTTAGAAPSCEGSIEAPKTTATAAPVATGFFSERSSDTDGREEDSLADRARDGTAAQRESNEDSRLVAEKQRLRPPFPPMPPIPPAPRPRTVEPGAPPSVPAASWDELEQGRSACEGVSLLSLLPNHCSTAAVVGGTTAQAPPLGPNRRRKEGERPRAGYWRPAGGVGKQNDPATAMVITTGIPPPFLSPLEEGDENEEREQEQHCEHDNEAAESKDWSKDEVEGHGRETSIVREVAGALALKETSVHAGGARKTSFVEEAMNERVPATSDEQEPEEGTEEERLMGGHREERHRELYLADRKEEANVTSLVPTDDYAAQNQLFIELGAVADDGEGQSRASWTTAGNGEAAERFRQRHTVPQTGQEAGALNGRDEAPRFVAEREAADREEDREESDSSYRRDCAVLAGTAKIVFALLALEHRGVSSRFYRWKRTRHRPQKNRSSSIAGSTGNDHPLPDKRQGYQ